MNRESLKALTGTYTFKNHSNYIDIPMPEPRVPAVAKHILEVDKFKAAQQEKEAKALRRVERDRRYLEMDRKQREKELTKYTREVWRNLITSREFQRNANHNWMHFDRFVEDVGLAPSEKHSLFKKSTHISYTKFSVSWI